MCNPNIFKTLAYSESKAYSQYCQTSIIKYFIQNPDIFRTLVYSQLWYILKSKYIQNPAEYLKWSILLRTLSNYSIFRAVAELFITHPHRRYWTEFWNFRYGLRVKRKENYFCYSEM